MKRFPAIFALTFLLLSILPSAAADVEDDIRAAIVSTMSGYSPPAVDPGSAVIRLKVEEDVVTQGFGPKKVAEIFDLLIAQGAVVEIGAFVYLA